VPIKTGTEEVPTADGGSMPAFAAIPDGGSGPGLVVVQEIFGVNDYVRDRARRLAGLGYLALAPDLYWRQGPGIEIDEAEEGGLERAFGHMQRLDREQAVADAGAALSHLREMPEAGGRAGVIGWCLGGMVAYQLAARYQPDVAVIYYGSGIDQMTDLAGAISCAALFHFGDSDTYLPPDTADRFRALFAGRGDVEFRLHHGAGHAFDNDRAPMFHHPQAAAESWQQTCDFLARRYPP